MMKETTVRGTVLKRAAAAVGVSIYRSSLGSVTRCSMATATWRAWRTW